MIAITLFSFAFLFPLVPLSHSYSLNDAPQHTHCGRLFFLFSFSCYVFICSLMLLYRWFYAYFRLDWNVHIHYCIKLIYLGNLH